MFPSTKSPISTPSTPLDTTEPIGHMEPGNQPMRLLNLPQYSPFLNPIEEVFGWLKRRVKKSRPCGRATLFDLIEVGQKDLSLELVASFYRHMEAYLPKCLARQPID